MWTIRPRARRQNLFARKFPQDEGFTMLEVLFAVGLFSLLAFFMTSTLISVNKWNEIEEASIDRMEWNVFIRQLDLEIQQASAWNVLNSKILSLQSAAGQVTFEPYGEIIRRRVGREGHEVILQNVKDYAFQINGDELTVTVQMQNGGQFEKKIYKRYLYEPSL